MSRDTNEGVMMGCKTIMASLLAVVGLLAELSKALAKSKAYMEKYLSIRQHM